MFRFLVKQLSQQPPLIKKELILLRSFSNVASLPARVILRDGNRMPILAFGTWRATSENVKQAVKTAIQVGYRHIDCAYIYQNQREVGKAIEESLAENSSLKREDLYVTSKLWNTDHHNERVRTACEQTIHELGVRYLDCYLIHWPVSFKPGKGNYPKRSDGSFELDSVPLWETWEAMQELHKAGLVKSIGVSNFSVSQLEELIRDSDSVPLVNQVELHPYLTQPNMVDYCRTRHIQLMAYSPLGSGVKTPPVLLEDPLVQRLATSYKKSPAEILLRWSFQKGNVVISKSVNPLHIKENFEIFKFELNQQDMVALDALNREHRYVSPSWSSFASAH